MNELSYGIKSGQIFLQFCHNASVWRQTDGRTDTFSSLAFDAAQKTVQFHSFWRPLAINSRYE